MKELIDLVQKWSIDKGLHEADPKRQMLKLGEEVGELFEGIGKERPQQIIDSIGDIQVVLIILCQQLYLDYEDTLRIAYEEIRGRKGKMIDGIFVKSEDIK